MSGPHSSKQHSLHKRDLIIIPALSLLTIFAMLIASELTARHFFYSAVTDSCQVKGDGFGFAFRPNCSSHTKTYEGPLVVNHYNDCGYRTLEPCGPKPAGTERIALIGSSVAQGWNVQYENTFAQRTAKSLALRCRRPVEVQNLGTPECSVVCMFHHAEEALRLKPDLLIIAISPYDIETVTGSDVLHRNQPVMTRTESTPSSVKVPLIKRIADKLPESRTRIAVEHFIYQDPATYLHFYMSYGDKADYLRTPLTAAWQERMQGVDVLLSEMAAQAHEANTKLVVLFVPSLPQAAMVALPKALPNTDASLIDQNLQRIAERHGIGFIDVLSAFRSTPGSNKDFYMTAPHLDARGHALVGNSLVQQLTEGPNPIIGGCATSPLQQTGSGF